MTSKQPAFQFYIGDYLQDTRCLSLAAKGAWTDCLCYMWRSQNRGELSYTYTEYARLFGCTVDQAKSVIAELVSMQICDTVTECNEKVTVINRRMQREAKERDQANTRVKNHREKQKLEGNGKSNAKVTPPSSSSSSPSTTVSNETGDPVMRRIWKDGVEMLQFGGMKNQSARSMLGKLAKQYKPELLGECIAATMAKNPVNPEAYLVGVLKERSKQPAIIPTADERERIRTELTAKPFGGKLT